MRSQQLLSRLILKLRTVPSPIIACVHGPAAGAGFAIALAADARIAARDASFSAAFVRLGLTGTDMGTSYFLQRHAGLGVASEMLLTGRAMGAERAFQLGLVNELATDAEAAAAAAGRLARDMLRLSPLGLRLTKEQLDATADGGSLRAAMTAENSHQMLMVSSPETKKTMQGWLKKVMGDEESPRKKGQRSKL
jgi:enoyl-CoA hydratase/carnithine racemase